MAALRARTSAASGMVDTVAAARDTGGSSWFLRASNSASRDETRLLLRNARKRRSAWPINHRTHKPRKSISNAEGKLSNMFGFIPDGADRGRRQCHSKVHRSGARLSRPAHDVSSERPLAAPTAVQSATSETCHGAERRRSRTARRGSCERRSQLLKGWSGSNPSLPTTHRTPAFRRRTGTSWLAQGALFWSWDHPYPSGALLIREEPEAGP